MRRSSTVFHRQKTGFRYFHDENPLVFSTMGLSILVLIQSNPLETHRPTEGLRIALGLSTGSASVTVVLLGQARRLLTEEASDVVEADILERHLPVIQELELPIVLPEGSSEIFSIDPDFTVREASSSGITSLLCQSDRVLVF